MENHPISISSILEDIPSLKREHEWEILDVKEDTFLLSIRGTGHHGGYIYEHIYPSDVAIVKFHNSHFNLEFIEEYWPSTRNGILNVKTSQAILVRLEEYDDTVEDRYGFDDVYIINYKTHNSVSIEPFHFGIGGYHGGEIKIALNNVKNWVAFSRKIVHGWDSASKLMVNIYDLTNMQLLIKSELKGIRDVDSSVFSGDCIFLIVTDDYRQDHIFEIAKNSLYERDEILTINRRKVTLHEQKG